MKNKILISFTMVLFLVGSVSAAEYYVSTTGDNTNLGTEVQPWLTLAYAESQLSAGDTVIVRGGTYYEAITINVANVTFQNYPSESPIIDGGWTLPGGDWGILVNIEGDGVTFDGFEVQESTGMGIEVQGADNVSIKNCDIHDAFRCPLRAEYSNYLLVEDSEIHDGVWRRWCSENPSQVGVHAACPAALIYSTPWPANVAISKGSDYATFRRCKIYDSHWEGLTTFESVASATVEYCEIYGNERMQLYFNCCRNSIARYNLIYGTDNGKGSGIWLNTEAYCYDPNYLGDHKIYGNLVANTATNLWIAGATGRLVKNVAVYDNTFVEATDINVRMEGGTGDEHVFKNNIIWQTDSTIASVPSGKMTCDYNLWSTTPDVDVQGANDPSYAVPQLLKTSGWNNLIAGELTGQEFTLQSTSPAINAGTNLGIEYQNALDPTSTWPDNVKTLNQNDYGNWEIGGFVFTGDVIPTCQSQGYQCCDSCESGAHTEYDADCTGQVCCGVCYVPDNIIDNGGSGTSFTGNWQISGGANPYGSDSLYSKENGATYTFTKSINGGYNVSLWWTSLSRRPTLATIRIYNGASLLDIKTVNQRINGGQWNLLGAYDFTGTARVEILSGGGGARTGADAVKFDLVSGSCGAADTNSDGVVSIIEIMAHITAWKAGSVTIENLMIGIGEWKNGC